MDSKNSFKENCAIKVKPPISLFQLLIFLIRDFVINLPRRIVFAIVTGFIILLVHTYLMVIVNEGFRLDGSSKVLKHILMLNGSWSFGHESGLGFIKVTLFWVLASMLFWGTVSQIRGLGLKVFCLKIFSTFADVVSDVMERPGSSMLSIFLCSICFGAATGLLLANPLVSLALAILLFLSVTSRGTSLLILTTYLAWCDFQRLFRVNPKKPLYIDIVSMVIRGVALGLILHGFTQFIPYGNFTQYAVVALFAILLVLNFTKKTKPNATSFLLIMGSAFFLSAAKAMADDGGWRESGGTLAGWLQSEGAWEALKRGAAPFIAAFLTTLGYATTLGKKTTDNLLTGIDQLKGEIKNLGDTIITFADTNVPIISGKIIRTTSEATSEAWDYINNKADDIMEEVETDTFNTKSDKNSAAAYIGNATLGGSYGITSGELEGFVGDVKVEGKSVLFWENTEGRPTIAFEGAAEATAADARFEGEIGTEDFSAFGEAAGKVLTAKAGAGIEADLLSGDANVKAEIGAAVLEGEVAGGFNVFGYKVKVGVSGSALSAQAKVAAGLDDGAITFEAKGGLGLGGGIKLSIGKN